MAITGWRGISDLCLALSVDAPPRATVMNLTITARDTSLERGTRTTEGQMPVFALMANLTVPTPTTFRN